MAAPASAPATWSGGGAPAPPHPYPNVLTCALAHSDWSMARDPDIWGPDCSEYKPTRWIDEQGRLRQEGQWKYHVFNGGPRLCLGMSLATFEAVAVIVELVRSFDIEYAPGWSVPVPLPFSESSLMEVRVQVGVGSQDRRVRGLRGRSAVREQLDASDGRAVLGQGRQARRVGVCMYDDTAADRASLVIAMIRYMHLFHSRRATPPLPSSSFASRLRLTPARLHGIDRSNLSTRSPVLLTTLWSLTFFSTSSPPSKPQTERRRY